MAATGNEVVLLSQLLVLKNFIVANVNSTLIAPTEPGSDGQILAWQMPRPGNTETIWVDPVDAIPSASQSSSGLMTSADKKKLDGIAANANNYVLPAASTAAIGGVKIVSDTDFETYLGIQ